MANPWFRMYSEFANDPKVQRLSEADQRRFVMLLCIKCNGDVTVTDEDVAFQLRISDEDWAATKAILIARGLITKSNQPAAWEKRQQPSDSSASRVAKHRELKKQQCNGDVTANVTNSNALEEKRREEEEKRIEEKRREEIKDLSSPSASTVTKGTRIDAGWVLPKAFGEWAMQEKPDYSREDILLIAENFKDHWLSNNNKSTSCKADWMATWRKWVRDPRNEVKKHKPVTQFKTAGERRMEVTDASIAEWLADGNSAENIIEGEVSHA